MTLATINYAGDVAALGMAFIALYYVTITLLTYRRGLLKLFKRRLIPSDRLNLGIALAGIASITTILYWRLGWTLAEVQGWSEVSHVMLAFGPWANFLTLLLVAQAYRHHGLARLHTLPKAERVRWRLITLPFYPNEPAALQRLHDLLARCCASRNRNDMEK